MGEIIFGKSQVDHPGLWEHDEIKESNDEVNKKYCRNFMCSIYDEAYNGNCQENRDSCKCYIPEKQCIKELEEKIEKQKDTILHLDSCMQDNIKIIEGLENDLFVLSGPNQRSNITVGELKEYIKKYIDEIIDEKYEK